MISYGFMLLSPILTFIPLISEAFASDPDYSFTPDSGTTCTPTQDEADRVQYFTHIALWSFLFCMFTANAKYTITFIKDYLEDNEVLAMANMFMFVVTGMLYGMGQAVLATEFTWGMTCNNYDETQSATTVGLLWSGLFLWVFASAMMHSGPKSDGYSLVNGGN
tara:strand:+ start:1162 stop:1653 length:492 start_codon:yes stop_codon:yes gene_type:complete